MRGWGNGWMGKEGRGGKCGFLILSCEARRESKKCFFDIILKKGFKWVLKTTI